MRTEKTINTFTEGIDRDTSFNKVDNKHYFDAQNLRIITNDPLTNGALSSVIGNTEALVFNTNDIVIGVCKIKNSYDIILKATKKNPSLSLSQKIKLTYNIIKSKI